MWTKWPINFPMLLIVSLLSITFIVGCASVDVPEHERNPVQNLIVKLLGETPAMWRQKLLDRLGSPDADFRREGVYMLNDKQAADWNVTPKILAIMAKGDTDGPVRAAALHVLAKVEPQGQPLVEILGKAGQDKSEEVQLEAIAVLAERAQSESQNDNDPSDLDSLILLLESGKTATVRSRAAEVMRYYRDEKSLRALVSAMADEEFAVTYRARQSLQSLTGEDFGYDEHAWGQFVFSETDTDSPK